MCSKLQMEHSCTSVFNLVGKRPRGEIPGRGKTGVEKTEGEKTGLENTGGKRLRGKTPVGKDRGGKLRWEKTGEECTGHGNDIRYLQALMTKTAQIKTSSSPFFVNL